MEEEKSKLLEEITKLKGERKDSVLRQKSLELNDKIEILMLENKRLKEIIREKDEQSDLESENGSVKDCNCGKVSGDVKLDSNSNLPTYEQTSHIAYV